jgi:hypothetical protein
MSKGRFLIVVGALLLMGLPGQVRAQNDLQTQLDGIKAAIPKFAVPMREVGDRFQNMYFAAQGENWGLANYMSKYMDKAMNPAKLTKPAEYPEWRSFYDKTFSPVNKAIMAQDFKAFEKEYMAAIKNCNECHSAMGYGFIEVKPLSAPADPGILYVLKSKAADVPK